MRERNDDGSGRQMVPTMRCERRVKVVLVVASLLLEMLPVGVGVAWDAKVAELLRKAFGDTVARRESW